MAKRILLVGELWKQDRGPNGVNVKNSNILRYLSAKETMNISVVDTYNWRKRQIAVLFSLVFSLMNKNRIVISLNSLSAYRVLRLINFMGLSSKTIYIAVGGNLFEQIISERWNLKVYKQLRVIFVQTKKMQENGKLLGMENVEILPNAKFFNSISYRTREESDSVRCFYLGRIIPEKGVEMIFQVLEDFERTGDPRLEVDFYGPVDESYKEKFFEKVEERKFAKYKGTLDFNNSESYLRLSKYSLCLFPTFWDGEGFPGIVVDSLIAGVPILASNWNHNSEVIHDGKTGLLFRSKRLDDFRQKLEFLINNRELLAEMSRNSLAEAQRFRAEEVYELLDRYL